MRTRQKIVLVIAVLFLIPAPVYAADSFLNIQSVKSPGGISAWLVEDHTVPVIAMEFSFRDMGAKNDPEDKQGLSQLASNTFDEGAGDIGSEEFQKTLQDLSISLTFSSDRDNFGGSLKTLSQNKERAFELLKLAITQPRFDADPVERMRASNKSRILSSMTEPDWMAARIQNDRIFEGHAYARNSGGTLSSLDKIKPEDLHAFQKKLAKNDLVVAVSGDMTSSELSSILDTIFASLPSITRESPPQAELKNAGKTYLFEQDIPQTIVEISQKGIDRNDPDYQTAQVMNYILGGSGFGSRLTDEIREKRGLTYGIYSYFREYEATKVFQISTSTKNENVSQILDLTKAEWTKMKTGDVSEKELKDAKAYLIGSLPLSLTSSSAIADLLLSLQMDNLPIDYLDQRKAKINAVTPADIKTLAQKLLDEKSFTTVLVGKPQGIEGAEHIKTLPNVE